MFKLRSIILSGVISCLVAPSAGFCQSSNDTPAQKKEGSAGSYVENQEQPHQLFEIEVEKPTAQPGEFVLCPSRQFYDAAIKDGVEKTTFIFYAAKMEEAGEHESKVTNLAGRTFTIPNQLIISIPPKQECEKGDILLTWWQTGSGMQRAFVVGETATEPVVRYLDVTLDNPSGVGKKEDTLKPGSFVVLNKEWQVGSAVAVDDGQRTKHGLLLAVSEEHVLVKEFAGILNCYKRENVAAVPIIPDVATDDVAMAAWHGTFKPVTVTKIDSEIGRVFVNFQLGRKDQERVISFGDLYKK